MEVQFTSMLKLEIRHFLNFWIIIWVDLPRDPFLLPDYLSFIKFIIICSDESGIEILLLEIQLFVNHDLVLI